MILYFADRHLNILGQASTHLPKGIVVTDDLKTEDVETGVSIFECDLHFNKSTRAKVEAWAELGNYILRSSGDEQELFTIIDAEIDTKKQRAYIYAEDDGLDLLNEIVGEDKADQPYPISHYIEKYAGGSGWEIGINEVEGLTRQLTFDNDETTSARLLRIAEAFNNCELSFSFKIDGLKIVKRYINIYEERGKDTGVQLRLNKEIDSIITTKSIANLATALKATGGTPDNSEEPITLKGYVYDDGDFYVEGSILKSRKALEKWSRYLWKGDETQQQGGHIVKQYSDESLSQAVLCENAIAELKSIRDMEINYEADIKELPDNVRIGDRVNIIDDEGELYLSSRVLILETSVADDMRRAVLGEHLIKKDGISSKVEKLAAEFAKSTKSVARAAAVAESAKELANEAKTQAETALTESEAAQETATAAKTAAEAAEQTALTAKAQAEAAKAAADAVVETVSEMETVVENAQTAAENAHTAAQTATQKAAEAKTAAENAQTEATTAKTAAGNAQTAAANAINKANEAKNTADIAKADAESAIVTAAAAKLDAEQAEKDVKAFEEGLETVKKTMSADYARKTDLTETEAELQTQLSQNAAEIKSAAYKLMVIDETANDAGDKVESAQNAAALAQQQADEAAELAETAQAEADNAKNAAETAQAEADTAKTAAETAKSVADNAEAALKAAKIDLATVQARADATEAEIAAAQQAVNSAQAAAETAIANAEAAKSEAEAAQERANAAVDTAAKAQANANAAANQAELAQQVANEAKGNAETAKQTAENALEIANTAQATADVAKATADNAQATANTAKATADAALTEANNAKNSMEQAAANLTEAQATLEEVRADAEASTEEIAEAEAAVAAAQTEADNATAAYNTAQAAADEAAEVAAAAQANADNAKKAATEAQQAAFEAQVLADIAQGVVSALYKRTVEAEAKIVQKADEIELSVKEVQTIADSNTEKITATESLIKQLSDSISMLVTDGNGTSLMKQTANGWTFSTSEIQGALNSLSETLEALDNAYGDTEAVVSVLKQAVDDIGAKTDYVNLGTYTYTNHEGREVTEPCVELGESDNDYKVLITNTQILFKVGSAAPTRINAEGLITENITVKNELRQTNDAVDGYYIWAVRENGNYGLQWKGAEA